MDDLDLCSAISFVYLDYIEYAAIFLKKKIFFLCYLVLKMKKIIMVLLAVLTLSLKDAYAGNTPSSGATTDTDGDVTRVICNVIQFVQKIGVPIMTGVILGSSIMAIFGRLAWPAIVVLVAFTGIFFGASKVMQKFANNIGSVSVVDSDVCSTP